MVAGPVDLAAAAEHEALRIARPPFRPNIGFDPVTEPLARQQALGVPEDAPTPTLDDARGWRARAVHRLDDPRDLRAMGRRLDRGQIEFRGPLRSARAGRRLSRRRESRERSRDPGEGDQRQGSQNGAQNPAVSLHAAESKLPLPITKARGAAGVCEMPEPNVLLAIEGALAVVTVNRPDKRNALDLPTVEEFHAALAEIARARCSAFIVTGAGDKSFVAGADINAIKARRRNDALAGINSRLMSAIENHDAVAIAAVNGFAMGGGCELALACDLRIAADNALFGLPEATLGIIPAAGGTQRLPRIVGLGRAKEMILTGARWDAKKALEYGLVSEVVPSAELMTAARAMAARVLSLGPLAIRLAKQALNASANMPLQSGLMFESMIQAVTFESKDKMEGASAFLEKRKPAFTGE